MFKEISVKYKKGVTKAIYLKVKLNEVKSEVESLGFEKEYLEIKLATDIV